MECAISSKTKLANAFKSLDYVTSEEVTYEEAVNLYLDKINTFKAKQSDFNNNLDGLITACSELSWCIDFQEAELMQVKSIIARLQGLSSPMKKHYAKLSDYRKKGIAKDIIKEFRALIGDLEEVADDLDFRFFRAPKDDEFQKLNEELQNL